MNHTYKLVWNKKQGCYVVAQENAKSHQSKSTKIKVFNSLKAAFVLIPLALVDIAWADGIATTALPENPNVAAGAAQFDYAANQLTIQQNTNQLVTNWSTFNIGRDAAVQFIQPNSAATALNRVNSNDPSYIFGSLSANGRVILINPNGVMFANGARVDVDSLITSTLQLTDQNFLNNIFTFEKGAAAGSILNQGDLNAYRGGLVALVAPVVNNEGNIRSDAGTVGLFSGDKVSLALDGNRLVRYTIDQGTLSSLIENKGAIQAAEGVVILSAKGVEQVGRSVVNNSGLIAATGITEVGGKILLEGDEVNVASTAKIDASGPKGGGEVLLGGDYQGKKPEIRNAKTLNVEADATIKADALTNGNGGKVILWSDEATRFAGSIYARGGAEAGNGGFVEVSSKGWLGYSGLAVARALNGDGGQVLLDPRSYYIGTDATGSGSDYSKLLISTLLNNLDANTGTTYTVAATNDIYLSSDISYAGRSAHLVFDAPVIALNGNISSSSAPLSVTLGNSSSAQNTVLLKNVDFNLNGGAAYLNSGIGGAFTLQVLGGSGNVNKTIVGGFSGAYWTGSSNVTTTNSTINLSISQGNTVTINFGQGSVYFGDNPSDPVTYTGSFSAGAVTFAAGNELNIPVTGQNQTALVTYLDGSTRSVAASANKIVFDSNTQGTVTKVKFTSTNGSGGSITVPSGVTVYTSTSFSSVANLSGLVFSSGVTIGNNLSLNSATLSFGSTLDLGSNALTISNSSAGTISGAISGTGSLSKSGSGTLTLNGTNTYSGNTSINAGTLVIGGGWLAWVR